MGDLDESKAVQVWEEGNTDQTLNTAELLDLIVRGHGVCGDFCHSRRNYGQERCTCVRSVFPTPGHYELYKNARNYYLKRLLISRFAEVIGTAHTSVCEGKHNESKSEGA